MPHKDPVKRRAYANKYYRTPEAIAKYNDSPAAKERRRKYQASPAGKAAQARYAQSPEGQRVIEAKRLRQTYGITLAEVERMFTEQAGVCACCGDEISLIRKTSNYRNVDHDHVTGKVRALLCHGCNLALGGFRDSPNRCHLGALYLEKHQ